METPYSNSCDALISDWAFNQIVIDTLISDKNILLKIEKLIHELKPIDTIYPVDGRIQCTLYYSIDSLTKLCLGSQIGTIYESEQVYDNATLDYLIKKFSGYYHYIPFEVVLEMPEIKDYPERYNEIIDNDTSYFKLGEPDIFGDSLIEIRGI